MNFPWYSRCHSRVMAPYSMQALLDCHRCKTNRERFLAIVAKTSQMTIGGWHCENKMSAILRLSLFEWTEVMIDGIGRIFLLFFVCERADHWGNVRRCG